mgnify:CR=1 FL=1
MEGARGGRGLSSAPGAGESPRAALQPVLAGGAENASLDLQVEAQRALDLNAATGAGEEGAHGPEARSALRP